MGKKEEFEKLAVNYTSSKGKYLMFYIIVTDNEKKKVVVASNGHVREFSKHKKAQNFINGRPYLKSPQIVVEISEIKHRFRVDI